LKWRRLPWIPKKPPERAGFFSTHKKMRPVRHLTGKLSTLLEAATSLTKELSVTIYSEITSFMSMGGG
jgi:hypothetical protein